MGMKSCWEYTQSKLFRKYQPMKGITQYCKNSAMGEEGSTEDQHCNNIPKFGEMNGEETRM